MIKKMSKTGIITKDQFMGLVISTESNGLDDNRLNQAIDDWKKYSNDNEDIDFGWVLCHLITKADINNLHRISKGFPEHIRIFAEDHLLANVDPDKIEKVLNDEE